MPWAGPGLQTLFWDHPLRKNDLVDAVLEGESIASGCRHGDNVLPSLFGGLVLVSAIDPLQYRQIPIQQPLWIPVLLPNVQVLTAEARAILPDEVPLRKAVQNASALAFMIEAFRSGDWEAVGQYMMMDQLIEPVRAGLVPCYDAVKKAALDAGAFGCALTGSGPAMYALAATKAEAGTILTAMQEASCQVDVACEGAVCSVNQEGVKLQSNPVQPGAASVSN